MTDKQIIIDGVDVSGCDFLAKKDDYCSYSGVTYAYKGQCMCSDEEMCKEHPKCFYKKVLKQLNRAENQIVELNKKVEAKEQECEESKKIINEAKNSKLDLKSFLVGEAVQNEYEQQLDQLKAENENFKSLIYWLHYGAIDAERVISEYYENRNTPYEENFWKRIRALQPCKYESKYKTALTEIKEIAEKRNYLDYNECLDDILQKISECEVGK